MTKRLAQLLVIMGCTMAAATDPGPVNLTGTITDLADKPVYEAVVSIPSLALVDTTDSAGTFTLCSPAVASRRRPRRSTARAVSLTGTSIGFDVDRPRQRVSMRLYDTRGALVATLTDETFGRGKHTLDLLQTLPRNLASSWYLLTVSRGEQHDIFSLRRTGRGLIARPHSSSAPPGGAVSATAVATAGAVHTLSVARRGETLFSMALSGALDTTLAIELEIIPDLYLDKIDELPDYYQKDGAYGGFPGGGQVYCAPTAVSNSLMWLADNGYPSLVAASGDRSADQHGVIALLASPTYMRLGPGGVGPYGVTRGLKSYISDRGCDYRSLSYQGWRYVAPEFRGDTTVPDLHRIKAGTIGASNAYINVGWYRHDAGSDIWTRTGGHWVAVVGYGHDGTDIDTSCLIIHDPWTATRYNEYWKLTKLTGGTMTGNYRGLPRAAQGFYKLEGRNAIVDCAVVLSMPEREDEYER